MPNRNTVTQYFSNFGFDNVNNSCLKMKIHEDNELIITQRWINSLPFQERNLLRLYCDRSRDENQTFQRGKH